MSAKPSRGPLTGQSVTLLRTRGTGPDTAQSATLGLAFDKGGSSRLYRFEPELAQPQVAKIFADAYRADGKLDPLLKVLTLVSHYDRLAAELPFVVWPDALVTTTPTVTGHTFRDAAIGFAMAPLPAGLVALHAILKVARHRKHFQSTATARLAARIADQLGQLHRFGFVFADLSPKNIRVSPDLADVMFLDADGFQVSLGGRPLPSRGVTQGYASPSTIANFSSDPTAIRPVADDDFVLAILIFQLLVDRAHPFETGAAFVESPNAELNTAIYRRWYAYGDAARFQPQDDALQRYRRLAPPIKEAFYRSFLGPVPMPAAEWARLLRLHADAPWGDHPTPDPNPALLATPPPWQAPPSPPATPPSPRPASRLLPPIAAPLPIKDVPAVPSARRFRRIATLAGLALAAAFGSWLSGPPAQPVVAVVHPAPAAQILRAAPPPVDPALDAMAANMRQTLAAMVRQREKNEALMARISTVSSSK